MFDQQVWRAAWIVLLIARGGYDGRFNPNRLFAAVDGRLDVVVRV
jgi:hypothetical protein